MGGGIEPDEIYVYNPSVVDDVAIAADIVDPETGKPSEANACLIAAAPELLHELRAALPYLPQHEVCCGEGVPSEDGSPMCCGQSLSPYHDACAAIEKATGAPA